MNKKGSTPKHSSEESKEEQLLKLFNDGKLNQNTKYLEEFDRKRQEENRIRQKREKLQEDLYIYYDMEKTKKNIRSIENYLKANERNIFFLPTKRKELRMELNLHKRSLKEINQRINEEMKKFDNSLLNSGEGYLAKESVDQNRKQLNHQNRNSNLNDLTRDI